MSAVLILPTISMVQGVDFSQVWRFLTNYPTPRTPIDLSNWSGEFTLSDAVAEPFFRAPLTLLASGDITLTIPAATTATFRPARQVGGRAAAEFQIRLEAPLPELSQVWQGGVSIARAE